MKPEHPATGSLVDVRDQQRVARRAPDALAEPVHHSSGQHAGPCPGRRDDDLAQRRHAVAGRDQRSACEAVAERSRRQLGQRGRTLGRPSTAPTTESGAPNTDVRNRQQRIEQLAGGVLQNETADSTRTLRVSQPREAASLVRT